MEKPINTQSPKILLVDDEEKLLMGLKTIMLRAGFTVQAMKNGNDALNILPTYNPDLIICDVMMPPPNGFQLKKLLSEKKEYSHIPFIFLTARTSDADKIAGLNLGADDYITKPFNIDELIGRAHAILRRVEIERKQNALEFDQKIEEIRSCIVANLSHELRTPLGVILAGLEMALREKYSGSTANLDWYLQTSICSAHRLLQLVNNLIILSDIDMGNLNTFRRPIDLRFQFYQVIDQVVEQYADKNLAIEISVDPDLVVYAPELEFSTLVSHLVDNACKFSPDGGKICIRLATNGKGGCVLAVSDQGPGIPVDMREKVFERYFQIDHGDMREFGGLGIGLTICKAIIETINGQIMILDKPSGFKIAVTVPPLEENGLKSTSKNPVKQNT